MMPPRYLSTSWSWSTYRVQKKQPSSSWLACKSYFVSEDRIQNDLDKYLVSLLWLGIMLLPSGKYNASLLTHLAVVKKKHSGPHPQYKYKLISQVCVSCGAQSHHGVSLYRKSSHYYVVLKGRFF